MWGKGLSERPCFWGAGGKPWPLHEGEASQTAQMNVPAAMLSRGSSVAGDGHPNPCFPPCPSIARGGYPAASPGALLPPPAAAPKALPIKAGTAETCVLWWRR